MAQFFTTSKTSQIASLPLAGWLKSSFFLQIKPAQKNRLVATFFQSISSAIEKSWMKVVDSQQLTIEWKRRRTCPKMNEHSCCQASFQFRSTLCKFKRGLPLEMNLYFFFSRASSFAAMEVVWGEEEQCKCSGKSRWNHTKLSFGRQPSLFSCFAECWKGSRKKVCAGFVLN